MPPIEDLIKEAGNKSYHQYKNIRNWVRGTWVFMIITTAIISGSLLLLSTALNKTTSVLERRSPVLEYMYCIDANQAKINEATAERNRAQTEFVLASFRVGAEPTPEELEGIIKLEAEYVSAEKRQIELSRPNVDQCPDAPS